MSTARALNALAGVIHRALAQDRTPMGIAFAVDAAGMHQTPEGAAALERDTREQVAAAIEERGRALLPGHPVYPYVRVFAALARGTETHEDVPELLAEIDRLRAELAARPRRAEVLREAGTAVGEVAEELRSRGGDLAEDREWAAAQAAQALYGMADDAEQDTGDVPPLELRWSPQDIEWGDDDSVTVLLSGPSGGPYVLELDPERAAALRADLAGPVPYELGEGAAVCCHLHRADGCCDPEDCGPCCESCPSCPTLARQRAAEDQAARDETTGGAS